MSTSRYDTATGRTFEDINTRYQLKISIMSVKLQNDLTTVVNEYECDSVTV